MWICCCLWHYLMSSVVNGCDLYCSVEGVVVKVLVVAGSLYG